PSAPRQLTFHVSELLIAETKLVFVVNQQFHSSRAQVGLGPLPNIAAKSIMFVFVNETPAASPSGKWASVFAFHSLSIAQHSYQPGRNRRANYFNKDVVRSGAMGQKVVVLIGATKCQLKCTVGINCVTFDIGRKRRLNIQRR